MTDSFHVGEVMRPNLHGGESWSVHSIYPTKQKIKFTEWTKHAQTQRSVECEFVPADRDDRFYVVPGAMAPDAPMFDTGAPVSGKKKYDLLTEAMPLPYSYLTPAPLFSSLSTQACLCASPMTLEDAFGTVAEVNAATVAKRKAKVKGRAVPWLTVVEEGTYRFLDDQPHPNSVVLFRFRNGSPFGEFHCTTILPLRVVVPSAEDIEKHRIPWDAICPNRPKFGTKTKVLEEVPQLPPNVQAVSDYISAQGWRADRFRILTNAKPNGPVTVKIGRSEVQIDEFTPEAIKRTFDNFFVAEVAGFGA
jgi:hypothetical protein